LLDVSFIDNIFVWWQTCSYGLLKTLHFPDIIADMTTYCTRLYSASSSVRQSSGKVSC